MSGSTTSETDEVGGNGGDVSDPRGSLRKR